MFFATFFLSRPRITPPRIGPFCIGGRVYPLSRRLNRFIRRKIIIDLTNTGLTGRSRFSLFAERSSSIARDRPRFFATRLHKQARSRARIRRCRPTGSGVGLGDYAHFPGGRRFKPELTQSSSRPPTRPPSQHRRDQPEGGGRVSLELSLRTIIAIAIKQRRSQ